MDPHFSHVVDLGQAAGLEDRLAAVSVASRGGV